jgi:hypothetical protein
MDIRKPKLIHNWREFFKEVGTIVLGVSIALAAEQGVEYFHWRSEVAQARAAIAREMMSNVNNAIGRLRTKDCTERRLDQLAVILDSASRTGNLPPVGAIGAPPRRRWISGAWDSVMASQVATHFPRHQLFALGRLYSYVVAANDRGTEENDVWSNLNAMVGPGRRLDPVSEAELRKTLGLARAYNRNFAISAMVILRDQKNLNLPYSEDDLKAIAAARREPLSRTQITFTYMNPLGLSCQPIGAVPDHYGQTSVPDIPGIVEEGMRQLSGPAGQ